MELLKALLADPGCPQCWADGVLAKPVIALEGEIAAEFARRPMSRVIPMDTETVAAVIRSGRRRARMVARVMLLEPHECGKRRD